MPYEIWEKTTRNLVASLSTEQEALSLIRAAIQQYGQDYAARLWLGYEDSKGRTRMIAEGAALAARASASPETPTKPPSELSRRT